MYIIRAWERKIHFSCILQSPLTLKIHSLFIRCLKNTCKIPFESSFNGQHDPTIQVYKPYSSHYHTLVHGSVKNNYPLKKFATHRYSISLCPWSLVKNLVASYAEITFWHSNCWAAKAWYCTIKETVSLVWGNLVAAVLVAANWRTALSLLHVFPM